MNTTKTKFPPTNLQQRYLLFETWEETGNVTAACQKAHVSRQTFYYWSPRFEAEGYAGLENRSSAPHNPSRTPDTIVEQVLEKKREHEEWGKRRLADELAKENSWVPLVSPNTVRRILQEAGLWTVPAPPQKTTVTVVRRAEEPGQTLNVDLCFVPACREEVAYKLPAVSGSSGRLVVEQLPEEHLES